MISGHSFDKRERDKSVVLTGDGKGLKYQVLGLTIGLIVTLLLLVLAIVRQFLPTAPLPEIAMPGPLPDGASSAEGNPAAWITPEDYPPEAIREGWEGTTRFLLGIDAQGRPRTCRIVESSGHSALDRATCRAMMRRGEFEPARDAGGAPIASTVSRRVRWVLPDDLAPPP